MGAAGGAATYKPEHAQFWVGDGGQVHGRNLTKTEKANRTRRALLGAALGAVAGGASSVGAGRLHERVLRRYDAADAPVIAEQYLAPLRELAANENKRVTYVPFLGRYSPESAERSANLLDRLSRVSDEAQATARANRAGRVFNGPLHVVDSSGQIVGPDPKNTARGVIHSRFAEMGLDPRNPATYRQAVEKRAYVAELEKLSGLPANLRAAMERTLKVNPPGQGRYLGGRRLPTFLYGADRKSEVQRVRAHLAGKMVAERLAPFSGAEREEIKRLAHEGGSAETLAGRRVLAERSKAPEAPLYSAAEDVKFRMGQGVVSSAKRRELEKLSAEGPVMGLGVKIAKKFGGTISKVPMVRPPGIVPGVSEITSLGSSITRTSALKPLTGRGPVAAASTAAKAAATVAK